MTKQCRTQNTTVDQKERRGSNSFVYLMIEEAYAPSPSFLCRVWN